MIHTRVISNQTVMLDCDPLLTPLADDVLDSLARIAVEKESLTDGMRIRFGWTLITLREQAKGQLMVCEPDFDGAPLTQIRPQLNTSLRVLAEQTLLLRRVGEEPVDVGFDQFVVAAPGALAAPTLQLTRSSGEADDSGWYITAIDTTPPQDPELLQVLRVFSLLSLRPSLMQVLALPPGYSVVMEQESIAGVWDIEGRDRWARPASM
jgi:hypothetical protein